MSSCDFAPLSGFAAVAFTFVVVTLAPEPDFIGLHHESSCKTDLAAVSAVRCSPLDSVTLT